MYKTARQPRMSEKTWCTLCNKLHFERNCPQERITSPYGGLSFPISATVAAQREATEKMSNCQELSFQPTQLYYPSSTSTPSTAQAASAPYATQLYYPSSTSTPSTAQAASAPYATPLYYPSSTSTPSTAHAASTPYANGSSQLQQRLLVEHAQQSRAEANSQPAFRGELADRVHCPCCFKDLIRKSLYKHFDYHPGVSKACISALPKINDTELGQRETTRLATDPTKWRDTVRCTHCHQALKRQSLYEHFQVSHPNASKPMFSKLPKMTDSEVSEWEKAYRTPAYSDTVRVNCPRCFKMLQMRSLQNHFDHVHSHPDAVQKSKEDSNESISRTQITDSAHFSRQPLQGLRYVGRGL